MRKTIDFPDDLSVNLEWISNETNISQSSLVVMASYGLIQKYQTHGKALFEPFFDFSNGEKTKIYYTPVNGTVLDIEFVENLIEQKKFFDLAEFEIYNPSNVPDRYTIQRLVDGKHIISDQYPFILKDTQGNQVWLANCGCGYGGEGSAGSQRILNILGVPYSLWELYRNVPIIEKVENPGQYTIIVTLMEGRSSLKRKCTQRAKLNVYSIANYRKILKELNFIGYPMDAKDVGPDELFNECKDCYATDESPNKVLLLGHEFDEISGELFDAFIRRLSYVYSAEIEKLE